MVSSSISEAERRAWNLVIGVGFVAVVAGSAGLIAFAGGATPLETGAVASLGLVTGLGLLWYLSRLSIDRTGGRDRDSGLDRRRR